MKKNGWWNTIISSNIVNSKKNIIWNNNVLYIYIYMYNTSIKIWKIENEAKSIFKKKEIIISFHNFELWKMEIILL